MAKKASSRSKTKGKSSSKVSTAMLSNYSKGVRDFLKKNSIAVGDFIELTDGIKTIAGNLLPQTELGDSDVIVLKQKNGYNVGIKLTPTMKVMKEGESVKIENFPKIKQKQKKGLPPISMIATGGTIASRIDYLTGGVVMASSPEEIFVNLPELFDEVSFKKIHQLYQLGSEDIGYKQWQNVAKTVVKDLNSGLRGTVIMHGTDMMGYTSAALSFMLEDLSKPVVMTGGQRSSDRGSFDGALNLISAARVAGKSDFAHVMVSMHETTDDNTCLLSPGTNVRKMHTSRRDAFKTINAHPIARIDYEGKITEISPSIKRRSDAEVIANVKYDPKVALTKIYPGADPEILQWYADRGIKGVIIEGTGLGHVPTFPPEDEKERSWIPAIERALEEGMFVGMTSQCLYGRTNRYVYRALRTTFQKGVTYLEDMLPETALVKLGWVLGQEVSPEETVEMMTTNLRGEINAKTYYYKE